MTTRFRLAFVLALPLCVAVPRAADARKCPQILFVCDRSGSMDETPSGGFGNPTKWELMVQAVEAAVAKYGDRLAFGLEMFTSNNTGQGCYTDTKIDVAVGHGTAGQIKMILDANMPSGGTNTGEAIKRGYTDGNLVDKTRGNYMILITDGDPNCNGNEPGYTISEITNATMQNPPVHTFVVGFDGTGGVNTGNLNTMAQKGLEPIAGCDPNNPMKPCYYSASTAQKFLTAIDSIIGTLAGGSVIGGCDDSCFSGGCPNGEICGIPQGQTAPGCFPDPCMNVMCDQATFCKNGQCVQVCPTCADTEKCVNGNCVNDPCAGVMCPMGQACDGKQGKCVMDKCAGGAANCPLPLFCDPLSGNCVDDPCRLINCPPGSTCYNGSCMTDPPPAAPPDLSVEADDAFVLPTGPDSGGVDAAYYRPAPKSGCSVSGGATGASAALLVGFALGAVLVRRGRRRAI